MPVIPVIGKLKQKIATKEIEDCKFQASSLFLKKKVMLMIPPNYKPKSFCIDPAIYRSALQHLHWVSVDKNPSHDAA